MLLFEELIRYCFSYLNTLSELLERLPEPNMIGERTFLPIFNIASRLSNDFVRSAAHDIENSNVWGYNNYTMAGDLIRDFSFIGCFLLPFITTYLIIFYSYKSSVVINLSLTIFMSGWLIYGSILNVLILGGYFISVVFLFALSLTEKLYAKHQLEDFP